MDQQEPVLEAHPTVQESPQHDPKLKDRRNAEGAHHKPGRKAGLAPTSSCAQSLTLPSQDPRELQESIFKSRRAQEIRSFKHVMANLESSYRGCHTANTD